MIDVKTIIFSNGILYISLAMALFFYSFQRKVYDGFQHWLVGTFFIGLAHFAILIRTVEWISTPLTIFLSNALLFFGFFMLLSGFSLFLQNQAPSRGFAVMAVFLLSLTAFFQFYTDSIGVRTLIVAAFVLIVQVKISHLCFVATTVPVKLFLKIYGLINLSLGIEFFFRGLVLFLSKGFVSIFSNELVSQVHLVITFLFQSLTMVCLVGLNSIRLENDLGRVNDSLKILQGLLPICASCKKIRSRNSEATFSHGICPDCSKKLYSEFIDEESSD
jgi:hypothetical protein